MFRISTRSIAAFSFLLASTAQAQLLNPTEAPARLILRYSDAASSTANASTAAGRSRILALQQARIERLTALSGRSLRRLRMLGTGELLVDAGSGLNTAALERLAERIRRSAPADLVQIEPDRLLQATAVPNDPYISSQWALAIPGESQGSAGINAFPAWDTSTGTGAVVAVIDTGYRPHADLIGQVIAQYDFIADSSNANDGDGRDGDAQDPGDYHSAAQCGGSAGNSSWHGTHVAGSIAALANNGLGVSGVAYNAKLVIARALGACGGYTSDLSDAIVWASGGSISGVPNNPYPAQVINMSLSGQYSCSSSPSMQAAIDSARSRNTTVVVAAGNAASDASAYTPASCKGVIAVTALGPNGNRASYANYGSNVDIAAPGGDSNGGILSTYNSGSTLPGSDNYAYLQGTSMAAPHVAGIAALLYSRKSDLTPDAVEAAIVSSTRAFTTSCNSCGSGMADAARALQSIAPGAGSLSFSSASYSVGEAGGSVQISVQRSGGSSGAISVNYTTGSGSATAGVDYGASSGTLQWADGESGSKSFSIPIEDDSTAEATESVPLALSAPSGGAGLGAISTASLTITDNDSVTGTLSLAATSYAVTESGGSVVISVTRSGGSNQAASVNYATANGSAIAGSDYTAQTGSLNWLAGDTSSKSFNVPILNDGLSESSESFSVNLSAASGAAIGSQASATVTIQDDDTASAAGTLAFSSATSSVNENGRSVTFTVTRSGGSSGAVSVNYASSPGTATAGSDYSSVSGTLSWAAGSSSSKTFTLPILDDSLAEANETVVLTLSNPSGGAILGAIKSSTLTISDNDASPGTLSLSASTYSVRENAGFVIVTVTRSGGANGPVSVNYNTANGSAAAGSDYTVKSGTLTWANNETASKTITVPILNDTRRESTETFQIRLSGVVTAKLGSPSTATVSISDND